MRSARAARAARAAVFLCALGLALTAGIVMPVCSVASPTSISGLRAQAASVRREVERLDHKAELLTEKYNAARAELDELNIRLQEARRNLERVQAQLEAAQTMRNERLVAMYKSDDYDMFDVLFSLRDIGEADVQLDYFRSVDEADRETVMRIERLEKQIEDLTAQIDADRAEALDREMALREQQAAIEDQLVTRQSLLQDLDARVKKLLARQARLEARASARLAKAAGVDLASLHGTPAQIAVVSETMKYLGIPYVWAGATPSGGFDCSGLVLYVYAKFGVSFPHGATMQAHMGHPVPSSQAQPADLVFFGSPAFYHHVGIYIGNGLFIEAPHTGDVVKVSPLAGRGCSLICRYPIRLM